MKVKDRFDHRLNRSFIRPLGIPRRARCDKTGILPNTLARVVTLKVDRAHALRASGGGTNIYSTLLPYCLIPKPRVGSCTVTSPPFRMQHWQLGALSIGEITGCNRTDHRPIDSFKIPRVRPLPWDRLLPNSICTQYCSHPGTWLKQKLSITGFPPTTLRFQ